MQYYSRVESEKNVYNGEVVSKANRVSGLYESLDRLRTAYIYAENKSNQRVEEEKAV